jgi:hypothetical protein
MDSKLLNGLRRIFFARTRTRVYRSGVLILSFAGMTAAQDPQFIRGQDSRVHGVTLDHQKELGTLSKMGISRHCARIKKQPSALALVGSEGASLDVRVKSSRGLIVLEGLRPGAEPKILSTRFLGQYKNYPISISAELGTLPGSRYPLALTIAASLPGSGDLLFQKGDQILVHADGQIYVYFMPEITIPNEGLLRLYLGTDDNLYFDAALTHPVHSGPCGSKKK